MDKMIIIKKTVLSLFFLVISLSIYLSYQKLVINDFTYSLNSEREDFKRLQLLVIKKISCEEIIKSCLNLKKNKFVKVHLGSPVEVINDCQTMIIKFRSISNSGSNSRYQDLFAMPLCPTQFNTKDCADKKSTSPFLSCVPTREVLIDFSVIDFIQYNKENKKENNNENKLIGEGCDSDHFLTSITFAFDQSVKLECRGRFSAPPPPPRTCCFYKKTGDFQTCHLPIANNTL